ncbi:hypothetical protein C3497_12560 [Zoogloeaceae bacteirum Par-f-2]|nr:hypothetical protein C3497_12560 [Zoogloeaceae bacteirum Par-f-2]
MRTVHDFDDEVAFMVERLAWAMEVTEEAIAWWDESGFAVVDEEVLRARSALQLLWDDGKRLPVAAIDAMTAADRQWRAHPKAFDHMFRYAIARKTRDELAGWLLDDAGRVPEIPASHWWWRPSSQW